MKPQTLTLPHANWVAASSPHPKAGQPGLLISTGTASLQERPLRLGPLSMDALLLEKTPPDILTGFENISPRVYKLLSSGGLDFLSIVFTEGILLLREHL